MITKVERYMTSTGETFETRIGAMEHELKTLFNGMFGTSEEGRDKTNAVVRHIIDNGQMFADLIEGINAERRAFDEAEKAAAHDFAKNPPMAATFKEPETPSLPPGITIETQSDGQSVGVFEGGGFRKAFKSYASAYEFALTLAP
jgi:hypothetical protein